jgi:hypothetical protein
MRHAHEYPHAQTEGAHREEAHAHAAAHASYSARKHPEFVVLDIGADTGALIIQTDPDLHGVEVEISPSGYDRHRSHKEVLERSINGRPAFTAVFDDLAAGTYTLWIANEARARGVRVDGGAIAELDWRSIAPEAGR